jgi:hypothetical protein
MLITICLTAFAVAVRAKELSVLASAEEARKPIDAIDKVSANSLFIPLLLDKKIAERARDTFKNFMCRKGEFDFISRIQLQAKSFK